MKKFIIEIEVDNNITLEDVESAISAMIDNYLDTTNGFYEITDTEIGGKDKLNLIKEWFKGGWKNEKIQSIWVKNQ